MSPDLVGVVESESHHDYAACAPVFVFSNPLTVAESPSDYLHTHNNGCFPMRAYSPSGLRYASQTSRA